MFNWYQKSKICFVYLEDVPILNNPFLPDSDFRGSRWWTRGWTLQELLAPNHVVFFNSDWDHVFTELTEGMDPGVVRRMLPPADVQLSDDEDPISKQETVRNLRYELISTITGIPGGVLNKAVKLSDVAAACIFSWAAKRNTTRVEDTAYCLLGLLGVNLPLLYGEGEKAFVRLQQAVINTSDDISMLSWGCGLPWESIQESGFESMLASSPAAFKEYPKENLYSTRRSPRKHATVTGHGLHIELPMISIESRNRLWLGIIDEYVAGQNRATAGIAIVLRQKTSGDSNTFERARGCPPIRIHHSYSLQHRLQAHSRKMVYIQDSGAVDTSNRDIRIQPDHMSSLRSFVGQFHSQQPRMTTELAISITGLRNAGYILSSQYPPIDHEISMAALRSYARWHFQDGRLVYEQQPFESLLCRGPHKHFYFILEDSRGHRVAVKVHIKYRGLNIR